MVYSSTPQSGGLRNKRTFCGGYSCSYHFFYIDANPALGKS